MCSIFRCCRLYSCIRLTCTSNRESVFRLTPVLLYTYSACSRLLFCLTSHHWERNSSSSIKSSSCRSSSKSFNQLSPIQSLIKPASRGLQRAIQRRGVTPFVLLLNFSGASV